MEVGVAAEGKEKGRENIWVGRPISISPPPLSPRKKGVLKRSNFPLGKTHFWCEQEEEEEEEEEEERNSWDREHKEQKW